MAKDILGAFHNVLFKIEQASATAVAQTGDYIKDEFKEIIQKEVYSAYSPKGNHPSWSGRTGALGESPSVVELNRNRVVVEFRNLNNWESVVNGSPFYALYGLEGGYTWNRPPSNIMETVTSGKFQSEIANEYAETMMTLGIPIVRK